MHNRTGVDMQKFILTWRYFKCPIRANYEIYAKDQTIYPPLRQVVCCSLLKSTYSLNSALIIVPNGLGMTIFHSMGNMAMSSRFKPNIVNYLVKGSTNLCYGCSLSRSGKEEEYFGRMPAVNRWLRR